jgi:hypothetical protein
MKTEVIQRSAAILTGLASGYVLWLVGLTALTAVIPMRYIIIGAAILLTVILIAAVGLALRFNRTQRRTVALAFWCAPTLPTIASLYLLIVFLN